MKFYVRRIVAELGKTDALTHLLPYEARLAARRG
jgi:hypothetical protein